MRRKRVRQMLKQRIKSTLTVFGGDQNRYLLTGALALFWVTFVSDIDLIYLFKSSQELRAQERQVAHYEQAIQESYMQLADLSSNPERLERFAREQYFMKRDNEDLFRILPEAQAAE
jgi:cell division protein FtsB